MSFFRSEPMSLYQMILHTESAFNCLIVLGYEGKVQFRNIFNGSPMINEQFSREVKRCQELLRLIGCLQQAAVESGIDLIIYPDVDEDEIPEADDLKIVEALVQQSYDELIEQNNSVELLRKNYFHLKEQLQVLERADEFFGYQAYGAPATMAWSDSVIKLLTKNEFNEETAETSMRLSFFTGSIPVERFHAFEIMLWRITKGYFVLNKEEFILNEKIMTRKYIFMVFFLGQELKRKVRQTCEGFGVKLFDCSESWRERRVEKQFLTKELIDMTLVLQHAESQRYNTLLLASADLYVWRVKVKKMLMVYYVLNHMGRVRQLHVKQYLQAECWIPSRHVSKVRSALLLGAKRTAKGQTNTMFIPLLNEITRRQLAESEMPTYFELNMFTKGFQHLIDSYGVAQYQELNPAPYTIITFPFLFAVMFGDMGHGFIMFLFAAWMVLQEKSLETKQRFATEQSEIFNILFAGRYIILLMGAFSIYTGLIYNDCFSKGLNLFGSSWLVGFDKSAFNNTTAVQLDPGNRQNYLGAPYIVGMDPIWKVSGENSIITFNSIKMKMAIILGVSQMVFGLVLSAFNSIYKKEYFDLLLGFLPQFIFLTSIFAYLVFLIFYKWLYFGGLHESPYNSACAPSILITFINMLMLKGPEVPPPGCETWMFDQQPYFEIGLLSLAIISIPVLLAGKPIYFMMQANKIKKIKNEELRSFRKHYTGKSIRRSLLYKVESSLYSIKSQISTQKPKDDPKTFLSELWIHSGIHCIESVLGSVSHTASYLRLWALSLAHEQLSTVLWNMVLKIGLTSQRGYWNSLVLYVVFALWATLTVAILVVMEGLSAFLHTLRLHWVEFQSKFYAGNGEPFQPFYFGRSSPNNLY